MSDDKRQDDLFTKQCFELAALREENERLKAEIKTEKLIWAVKEDQMRDNFKRCKDAAEHWKKEAETLTADKRELVEACRLFIKHAEGYNVDGSKRPIEDDDNCGRNYNKVISKAKATLEGKG